MIATDHAPHHYDAKEREFDDAPNGIIGLETAFGLAMTELVEAGAPLAARPAVPDEHPPGADLQPAGRHARGGRAGRRGGAGPGGASGWWSRPAFYSKSRNTPFAGRTLTGRAELTIVRGRVVYERARD